LGGLVVKKALILAQRPHVAASIRKATAAVVFMGTPHRGSEVAKYADIAAECIKALGFSTNLVNIKNLKRDSRFLEELCSEFGSLLQSEKKIKVLTFYELQSTRIGGIGSVV